MSEIERFTVGDPEGWLEWSEVKEHGFRNGAEYEFLTAFFARVPELSQFGITEEECMINYLDSRAMIGFDMLDSTRSVLKRCLKVEFTGEIILLCSFDSSTFVFMFKADPNDSDVIEYRKTGASPTDLANKALEWTFNEFSKKSQLPIKAG